MIADLQADALLDVLAMMTAFLDEDQEAWRVILASRLGQAEELWPLLGVAVGLVLRLAAEHGDPREWIAAERERTWHAEGPGSPA